MKTTQGLLIAATLAVALFAAAFVQAGREEHSHDHAAVESDPATALSPELRQLLVKEMQLIDDGMGELLSAISAGNWETTESIAHKIQHSFILKQRLTEPQLHELHEKLPKEFVRMDVRFHQAAGKLAAVAHRHDAELAAFYYSRLVDGCVNCHAAYAPARFPGLAPKTPGEHRH